MFRMVDDGKDCEKGIENWVFNVEFKNNLCSWKNYGYNVYYDLPVIFFIPVLRRNQHKSCWSLGKLCL